MTLAGQTGNARNGPSQPPPEQAGSGYPERAGRSLLNWRDWGLPAKLAAVTVVPLAMAMVLGVTTLSGQVQRADGYERVDRLVALNADVRTLLGAVQNERDEVVGLLNRNQPVNSGELRDRRGAVDEAIVPLTRTADRAVEADQRIEARHTDVTRQLDRLGALRDRTGSGRLNANQAISEYTAITGALLDLDRVVVSRASEGAVGGSANALHNLEVIKEEFAVQKARVAVGIARGGFPPNEIVELRTSVVRLNDRVGEFRAVASAQLVNDYDRTVSGEGVDARNRMMATALGERGGSPATSVGTLSEQEWNSSASAVVGVLDKLCKQVGANLSNISKTQQEDASSATGLAAVVLFAAFVLAIAVVVLITRQLLRSLRVLRRGALDVADRQLPSAVTALREGQHVSDEVAPVSVHSMDEVGQVARAFDALHRQALRLAIEQTTLRTSYSNVFVNLSRRSQSLVQRQLQLIEQLERDEEDSEQLSTLFQLDHLATRMRRNNENLMVLSGSEPSRRSGQPVAVSDLLRAAVSEIEQYQRVMVQPPPSVLVVGYAGSDLMRLVAELLDNATAFSAPDTKVTVASRLSEDGSVSVDVLDQGIGMSSKEVEEANERLASAGAVDPLSSRRMGLFVVGRLASRHDIRVQLYGGKDITGVRATVIIPAELVVVAPQDQPAQQEHKPGPGTGGEPPIPSQTVRPSGPGELPRRQRPTNGSARPGALSNLMGQSGVPEPATGSADEAQARQGEQAPEPADNEHPSGVDLFSPIPRSEPEREQPPADEQPDPQHDDAQHEDARHEDTRHEDTRHEDTEQQDPESGTPQSAPEQPGTEQLGPEQLGTEQAGTEQVAEQSTQERAGSAQQTSDAQQAGDDEDLSSSSALSDWWATTTQGRSPATPQPRPEPAAAVTESTPIFDEMLSAWFRTQPEASEGRDAAAAAGGTGQWSFAADAGWQTVESVSRSAPSSFTSSGLPRRVRGQKLMPGTASSETPAAQPGVARRDPSEVRGRLSSFQQGVSRGRGESKHARPSSTEATDRPAFDFGGSSDATEAPAAAQPAVPRDEPAPPGTGQPTAPEQSAAQPEASAKPEPASQPETDTQPETSSQAEAPVWPSHPGETGSGQPAPPPQPGPAAQPGPSQSGPAQSGPPQSGGGRLPARPAGGPLPSRRGERSGPADVPGSLWQPSTPAQPGGQQQPPAPASPNGAQPSADPDTQAYGPTMPYQDQQSQETVEQQAQGGHAMSAEWNFAADAGWQTVDAVSQAAPASFTSSGLPRRVRGEKLLPGSAESGQPGGVRTERDPQGVRGRMSSFQQGLRRGRHHLAQRPGTGNDEESGG